jgi:hypothetical protein
MFDFLLFVGVAVCAGASFYLGYGVGYLAGKVSKK